MPTGQNRFALQLGASLMALCATNEPSWTTALFRKAPMGGRSASQPSEGGGRKLHEWWAARLPNVFWLSALAVRHAIEAADRIPLMTAPIQDVDGPSLAKALAIEALENNGKLSDGTRITVAELHRRLTGAGVNLARSALYENDTYAGVRALLKKLGLFEELPEEGRQEDAVRRGTKDKATGQVETPDHREEPPDAIVR